MPIPAANILLFAEPARKSNKIFQFGVNSINKKLHISCCYQKLSVNLQVQSVWKTRE
jgi:hypothetical protein